MMPGQNGGRPGGSICAIHDERIDSLEERMDLCEEAQGRILAEVSDVRLTLGRAPDPVSGTPGSGAVGIIYKIGNQILTGAPRTAFDSFASDGEGDVTKVQTRPELVDRAKAAEEEREKLRARVRLALIGLGVTTVTTIGTVALAWLGN